MNDALPLVRCAFPTLSAAYLCPLQTLASIQPDQKAVQPRWTAFWHGSHHPCSSKQHYI